MKSLLKKIRNRIAYRIAMSSGKKYEDFLRKIGCSIGENIDWSDPKTIDIDVTRPCLVEIGNNVRINKNFTLMTHDGSSMVFRNLFKDFIPASGMVHIGNNVYFGRQCTVLKGVTIGDNCIIGFGSLVTKSIPANSVAVGRPAKVVSSIEEYYKKRKEIALQEAFEYARVLTKKLGRKPTMFDLYEEFPFYLDGDAEDPGLRIPISRQTRGISEEWKKNHKALFRNFEEFLEAAGIE